MKREREKGLEGGGDRILRLFAASQLAPLAVWLRTTSKCGV